ncbi:putative calcium-dependent channel, 7TM region phosphate [Helianthus annuus]|uniref:Calcium-dependent channel, 7TM region phosphate n=1 Tax=Helianthus annuus TaxID=4232 RepID=A0A251V360_HELAN|nr:CSC1-like protein At4g02900 [Helianthus annuus]XP_035844523.1 CSC1-like protein At4g02900 [Helianthus annuus]KAF5811167.1 putative calcium-dependent channel, 7TM region phosphate [Helianthus annuus]KAJ0589945.1 putative calcium-dependent channel, 7TM region phosphate [Helianthus annuus]KAJ0758472.1 putative calcium-dependent channel, 7TM region phosphate [Helianthus annuus]KAJ0762132.1 putative calcium-dependent channel, 7TM region phosphate [Helianthus annuus]KAJ0927884.1 putative calcium
MATLSDITVSASINSLFAFLFLVAFAILRLQPMNDRVYFPKWYLKGIRENPSTSGPLVKHYVNLDVRMYLRLLNWIPAALKMPQLELIEHAGLDSAVYIRIYLLGLKIFVPIALLAFAVLLPVNYTGGSFSIMSLKMKDLTFGEIDKFSISNVPPASKRLAAHIIMAYVFTFWTCYILYKEYKIVTDMRLNFLASQKRRPDQFTVIVRNVPSDADESVSEHVEHFFRVNHPGQYLTHKVVYNANKLAKMVDKKKDLHNRLIYYTNKYERRPNKRPTTKTGFWGLWGKKIDAINYYTEEIDKLGKEEVAERERVIGDPEAVVPAAFVSFRSRWGAAVCAQTQQTRNPTRWLTDWAPEPRDVYWSNLAIPFVELNVRKLVMAVALFGLIFSFMIPITIVQTLANIESIEKVLPFLKPIVDKGSTKSFIQGFLPGMVLKIFLLVLPMILMEMSKIEGYVALSDLEAKSAAKFYFFLLVNVFLGSIVTGTALQQLKEFLNKSASEIPKTVGVSVPMKATFFITYIMVDGWAGIAAEVLRLFPLIMYHLKNIFLVKTDKDRDEAMDPGSLLWPITEPRLQLYFLLGLVYSTVTPILLPFIIIFFAFAYLIFRHQIINVYHQKYESAASFWPDVNRRILIGLIISQLSLLGLLSTKQAANSTPVLLVLPVLTFAFHKLCKNRFESAFRKFPLQDAMVKDTLERATEPQLNLKEYLKDAYTHPVFKGGEVELMDIDEVVDECHVVATKRSSRRSSLKGSQAGTSDGCPEDRTGIYAV